MVHKPVPLRPSVELIVEQLASEPPRRLRLREEDAQSVFEVEYRLDPAGACTRFTQVSQFHWKGVPAVLGGVLGWGVRRDLKRQLRELKRVLERG